MSEKPEKPDYSGESNRRRPSRGSADFEREVAGVIGRMVKERTPIDEMSLREEGAEREKIMAAARVELERLYGRETLTVMDADEEDTIEHYGSGFRALKLLREMGLYDREHPSKADVDFVFSPAALRAMAHLENFRILPGKDGLLVYDGGPDVPEITRGFIYPQARMHCVILGLSMMKEEEFRMVFSWFGTNIKTWLESPSESLYAQEGRIHLGAPVVSDRPRAQSFSDRGLIRVVRIRIVSPSDQICMLPLVQRM